jgi:hypothetical protein
VQLALHDRPLIAKRNLTKCSNTDATS